VNVNVRRATAADIADLASFQIAMAAESEDRGLDRDTITRGVTHLIEHPSDGFYLVAVTDQGPVGSLMVTHEWSDWRAGRFWWIQSVYVDPAHRRRGVYTRLHAAVRDAARADPESCGLRLYVERENAVAQATYRALGMRETHYRVFEEVF
jgi:ribosomal protein S18 acetylase RimI-like enzyme